MYFYYFPLDLFLEIGQKLDNFFRWLKKNCFWDFLTFSQKFDSQFQLRQKGKIKSFSIFEIKRHGITTLNQCDMSTTSTCFLRGQSSLISIRSSSILFTRHTFSFPRMRVSPAKTAWKNFKDDFTKQYSKRQYK